MPWKVETRMSAREEFIALAASGAVRMSELCGRFTISRKTGYKWLRRYASGGAQSLRDRSHRTHTCPHRTRPALEERIIALRQVHPTKGAHVLARMLQDQGVTDVPAKSTISAILKRHGLIDPTESAKHTPYVRFERPQPNELWQLDFKGHFIMHHDRCHPLTLLDDHSRFNLALQACANERGDTVQDRLTAVFRRYGVPQAMLMDNGSPWGNASAQPFTPLTVWLMHLGISVLHSRPYHPQTLGKLERFHRSLKSELLQGRTFTDLDHCQLAFDTWRDFYNLERPHHALDLDTPITRYTPSPRPFPETLPAVAYAPDDLVRSVDVSGRISFQGSRHRVGRAFTHKQVALRPTQTDGVWDVHFSIQRIKTIDLREQNV